MKKITLTLVAIASALASFAQTGATCNDAIPETSNSTCNFTSYVTTSTEMWFEYTATSENINIEVITTMFGANAPHIHNVALLGGICSNLQLIADDELPFVDAAEKLSIDLDASGLIVGDTYYILLKREATGTVQCDKGACFPVVAPASFDLCIEEIDVFIPLDFGLEAPSQSNAYYTNKGQVIDTDGNPRSDVKLYTPLANPAVFIGNDFTSFVFSKIDSIDTTPDTLHRVDMTLVGMNTGTRVFKMERVQGIHNYHYGHLKRSVGNTKGFSRAVCNDVYTNIDMQLYSSRDGMKFYFIVRPNGDPDNIVMKFDGATAVNVTGNGGLEVVTPLGKIEFEAGHAYSINLAGNIVPMPWQADFIQVSSNTVKFDIRQYPSFMPLIIQVDRGHTQTQAAAIGNLEWSTYYGGTIDKTIFTDLVTDSAGNSYSIGYTQSVNFPTQTSFLFTTNAGSFDAVVVKFDSTAVRQWATYFGGFGQETRPQGAVDGNGDFYIAGTTTNDSVFPFPISQPVGAFADETFGGVADFFVAKISADGSALIWSSLYGGSDSEVLEGLEIDQTGNLYLVGVGTINTPLNFKGGAYFDNTTGTGLVVKFDSQLALDWATLFGGGDCEIRAVTSDDFGNTFITGDNRADLPLVNPGGGAYFDNAQVTSNFQHTFVSKFDVNDALTWSTYFSGTGSTSTIGHDILSDGNSVFVTGQTNGAMPILFSGNQYVDNTVSSFDAFIVEFDNNGVHLWSSLYGGSNVDLGVALAVDDNGVLYLGGHSNSSDLSTLSALNFYNQSTTTDNDEAFIVAFKPSRERLWATYFGGDNNEGINAMAIGGDKLYMNGKVNSPNASFPLEDLGAPAWFDDTKTGTVEHTAWVARFDVNRGLTLPPTGIDDASIDLDGSMYIYPNPNNGQFTVELSDDLRGKEVEIAIYDIRGRKLYAESYRIKGKFRKTIDLTRYSNGTYMISVTADDKTIARKLIKQQR